MAQKASLQNKLKIKNKTERKARTRTLIQLGGLLSLTPILDICNIHLGEDLQLTHQDKADILLGILSSLVNQLSANISQSELASFGRIGESIRKSF